LARRLAAISAALGEIIRIHSPGVLSLEKSFAGQNIQSAFRLGEARGAVLVAAASAGLRVREYSPAEVKLAVAGYGRAGKAQVQGMVARLLGLATLPAADEADALAVALCHLHSREMVQRLEAAATQAQEVRRRDRCEAAR
jgi:crossover junction endodeoxyribonuclease RuvC